MRQVKEGDALRLERRKRSNDRLKRKGPSLKSKIKIPFGRDIPAAVISLEFSNPSLVYEKYVQWPREQQEQPPRRPRRERRGRHVAPTIETQPTEILTVESTGLETSAAIESAPIELPAVVEAAAETLPAPEATPEITTEVAAAEQQTAAETSAAPPAEPYWKLLPRHKRFFLSKTMAQLYRNYERRNLPWTAVRSRKESMLRALEYSGYVIASEMIRGPWRFAVSGLPKTVIPEAALSFDRNFGYPIIPAHNLQSLLYAKGRALHERKELSDAAYALLPEVLVFDAGPASRVGLFTIEETLCHHVEHAGREPALLYGFSTGQDTAFAFSIAAKDPSPDRHVAKEILGVLASAVRSANEQFVKDGDMSKRVPSAGVLF